MPVVMQIRKASSEDIEQVVALITEIRKWQAEVGEPAAFGNDRRVETADGVRNGHAYVGQVGRQLMSTCTITRTDPDIWPDADNRALYLHRLVVAPAFHKNGFACQWIDFAAAQARELGRNKLRLDAVAENTVLCDWYKRRGFEEAGMVTLPNWVRASMRFEKVLE